ncbi:hypothetical protein ACB098_12G113600 [Castanea mollissima]
MAAAAIAFPIALPNCSDRCGNVKIPYPYGTTKGCYLNDTAIFGYYFINCTTTNAYGQPQPIIGNINVSSISMEEGEIEVQIFNSLDCYDKSGASQKNKNGTLTLPSFTVSATKNKFVAVGCDTYAYLNGDLNSQYFSLGCLSKCQDISNVVNGTCSGIGCCEVQIPEGMKNVDFDAYSFKNHTEVWDFNPCSYAFIVRADKFNFSSDYLISLQYNRAFPMVLDWAIGNEMCEVARNKANYLCGENTTSSNLKNQVGYRCKRSNCFMILKNYINECEAKELNNCTSYQYCVNELGSYNCSCMEGYHSYGKACVPDQSSLTIKLTVGGILLQQKLSKHQGSVETANIYSAEELEKATNNYNESRVLGQGGYGTVYRGILPDNKVIAIKKSKIGSQRQVEQFINEITVLTQIIHRNVVKLLGCCLETEVSLLVYEFITNGTLSDHIHDKGRSFFLSWEKRLKIAAETAGALAYLHSALSVPIIHRDVKTTNILLDDNFTAKVSDFGASRLIPHDQTELNTLVQGTFGYMDPKYFHTSQLTEKSDVYSFGVVLAELLTSRMALSFNMPEGDRNLAKYFVSAVNDDQLFQILEDHIVNEGNIKLIKEVANIAKSCLSLRGEDRPSMKEVEMELEGLLIMEKHPWGNANVNIEETENLLNAPTQSFNIDVGTNCSSNTTTGYDSMINHVLKPLDGGR